MSTHNDSVILSSTQDLSDPSREPTRPRRPETLHIQAPAHLCKTNPISRKAEPMQPFAPNNFTSYPAYAEPERTNPILPSTRLCRPELDSGSQQPQHRTNTLPSIWNLAYTDHYRIRQNKPNRHLSTVNSVSSLHVVGGDPEREFVKTNPNLPWTPIQGLSNHRMEPTRSHLPESHVSCRSALVKTNPMLIWITCRQSGTLTTIHHQLTTNRAPAAAESEKTKPIS